MIHRANGSTPAPQIFDCTPHLCGFAAPHALERAGKLDPLLDAEGVAR
jgi:hypothetical protein